MPASLTFNETEIELLYEACNNEWLRLRERREEVREDGNDSLVSLLNQKMLTIDSITMRLYSVMPKYK